MVGGVPGVQESVPVYYAVAPLEDAEGAGVGLDDLPVAVKEKHTDYCIIEQVGERGMAGIGFGQCLPDTDELTQVGQQAFNEG